MAGRWKRHEREVAATLGGRRLPNNGAGQPDVLATVAGVPCAVQVKTRALPAWLLAALDQATRDAGELLPVLVLSTAAPGVKARRLAVVDLDSLPALLALA